MWLTSVFEVAFAALAITGAASAETTLTTGVDVWDTSSPNARYMPNYSTPNEYKTANKFAKAEVSTDVNGIRLTGSGRYSDNEGGRIDRLDADIRIDGTFGVRLGILPYRVSWCRHYERDSVWIREPDPFCSFYGLAEMSEGSFGVQGYASTLKNGFMIDTMIGVYNPQVDNQDKKLGPYVSVGPTVSHKKAGFSANAIHLASGVQSRFSLLRTEQVQNDATGSKSAYQRDLTYDTIFYGIEGNITDDISLRYTSSNYIGSQNNPRNLYDWNGKSDTVELTYKKTARDSFSYGYNVYENITKYAASTNIQNLQVKGHNLSWRHDFDDGLFTVIQYSTTTDDYTTIKLVNTYREGRSIGFRLAKTW